MQNGIQSFIITDFKYFIICFSLALALPSCFSSKNATRTGKGADAKEVRLRRDITRYAEGFIGAKYKYGGVSPSSGFDCSGFTVFVMDAYGVGLNRTSTSQSTMGKKIPLHRAQGGDLVFFSRRGKINHVALVDANTDEGIMIIHSTSSRGVIRENLSASTYWKPKIKMVRDVISDL